MLTRRRPRFYTFALFRRDKAMRLFLCSAVLAVVAMGVAEGQLPAAGSERAPATIDVTTPADAQLTIDGQRTVSASSHRRFITPPLEVGKAFQYALSAKFVRDGKTISVERKVLVRSGQVTFVSLDPRGEALAFAPSPVRDRYTDATSSPVATYYYDPETPEPVGADVGRPAAAATVVNFSSRSLPSGGFQPIRWGCDQSDAFYHSGQ